MTSLDSWVKAAASNDAGSCVEMRRWADLVEVRDTKAGDFGPILRFVPAAVDAWLEGAKAGRFDHLSLNFGEFQLTSQSLEDRL
jgi:hypothetical protein